MCGRRSVGVVIMDGGFMDFFRILFVIKKIKEKGINMFVIGKNKINLKLKIWIDFDDIVIFFYLWWLWKSDKELFMVLLSIKILIKKNMINYLWCFKLIIGVGMSINEEELRMIVLSLVSEYKFMVENLDGLKML